MAIKKTKTSRTKPKPVKSSRAKSASKKNVAKASVARETAQNSGAMNAGAMTENTDQISSTNPYGFKIPTKALLFVVPILIVLGLGYYFRSELIVATVNGSPVTRVDLIKELEAQSRQQAIETLVTKRIILQEAKKTGATVSDDEVNAELDKIKASVSAQGGDFEEILALQGLTIESLREQIRLQSLLVQMATSGVQITDEDVAAYVEENLDMFPEEMTDEEKLAEARAALEQQKNSLAVQQWLQELKDNAEIVYF
jgi:foldase protein PrsA